MGDLNIPLDYDVIELTFVLRSIGFHLKSFEFLTNDKADGKELEIDLTCHTSGLRTKFVLASDKCTCPPQPSENNNSFWEVQGKCPSTPTKKLIQESSCNLLPEINKKTTSLARSTLLMLLQHYRNDLLEQQKSIPIKELPKSPKSQLNEIVNNAMNISPTFQNMQNKSDETTNHSSTPLNRNAVVQPISASSHSGNIPKIKLEKFDEPGLTNCNTEVVQNSYVSPEFTPTKSSVVFPSPQISKMDNDRDVYIIESISRARKELDAALLHLKCNITRDLSESSILNHTPEGTQNQSTAGQQFKKNTRRRASLGSSEVILASSKDHEQFEFQKPPTVKGLSNGMISAGKLKPNTASKNKLSHPDTPRPHVDLKTTVEKGIAKSKMLRSATSGQLKGSTAAHAKPQLTKQKSALPLKK